MKIFEKRSVKPGLKTGLRCRGMTAQAVFIVLRIKNNLSSERTNKLAMKLTDASRRKNRRAAGEKQWVDH